MTLDADGFLRWKGVQIEHFPPDFADSDRAGGKARILAARCRHLESKGKDVNRFNAVLDWKDRVWQPLGAGRER
jgi:hypothetical protein